MFYFQLFSLFSITFIIQFLLFGSILLVFAFFISSGNDIAQPMLHNINSISGISALSTAIFVFGFYHANKKAYTLHGKPLPTDPIHIEEFSVNLEISQAFLLCLKALDSIPEGLKKIETKSDNFKIIAITNQNKKSSKKGETIIFDLDPISESETRIVVSSKSNHLLNLLDSAKNLDNLKIIEVAINKN